jgi:hypothetical protein
MLESGYSAKHGSLRFIHLLVFKPIDASHVQRPSWSCSCIVINVTVLRPVFTTGLILKGWDWPETNKPHGWASKLACAFPLRACAGIETDRLGYRALWPLKIDYAAALALLALVTMRRSKQRSIYLIAVMKRKNGFKLLINIVYPCNNMHSPRDQETGNAILYLQCVKKMQ